MSEIMKTYTRAYFDAKTDAGRENGYEKRPDSSYGSTEL